MRTMRLLVLFDLPTGNKQERKTYSQFRKVLLDDGYCMEQYSVYSRLALSRDALETHLARLPANLPAVGAVTALALTEKQYESRQVLVRKGAHEHLPHDFGQQLTLFF